MKKLVILCILSLVSVSIFAQIRRAHSVSRRGLYGQYDNAVAITLAGGNSYYFGDIERTWIFSSNSKYQSNYYVEGNFAYSFYQYIKLRANVIHAKLSGKRDSYEFKSTVFEPSFIVEYHPFTITSPVLDFYALAGIGVTFSDIKGNDITYKAQRNVYLNTPVIPFGVGYKYNFKNGLQIGAEFNFIDDLMDNENHTFDGFPYTYKGPHPNSPHQPHIEKRGLTSRFVDMYYVLGITVGYQWQF